MYTLNKEEKAKLIAGNYKRVSGDYIVDSKVRYNNENEIKPTLHTIHMSYSGEFYLIEWRHDTTTTEEVFNHKHYICEYKPINYDKITL